MTSNLQHEQHRPVVLFRRRCRRGDSSPDMNSGMEGAGGEEESLTLEANLRPIEARELDRGKPHA